MPRPPLGLLACAALAVACAERPSTLTVTQQTSGTDALLISVSPVNDKIVWVAGAKGTWLRTTDGGDRWITGQVAGAESLQFRDVHGIDSLTAYLLSIGKGPDSRIYKTADGGKSWMLQLQNTDTAAFFDCFDFWDEQRGMLISDAVYGELLLLETEDGGANWTRVDPLTLPSALPNEGSFAASGTCVIARPGGRAWVSTKSRLLMTANYGRRWSVQTLPLTHGESKGVFSLAFRDAQFGAAFAADAGQKTSAADTLLLATVDGGVTWTPRSNPPLASGTWAGAHVPGLRALTLIAAGPSGIAWSSDDGISWTKVDTLNYWGLGAIGPKQIWAAGAGGRIAHLRIE
jgi:photosystem II stability/assembly factor-like uncharacterized protein